jgi:hypothetical protein
MPGKETITVARLYACRSAIAAAGMQALTRRDDRQVRRHHTGFAKLMLFHAVTPALVSAASKVFGRNAGDRAAHARVGERQTSIGEKWLASADRKRSNKAAMAMEIVDHGNVHNVYVIEAAPIPGIERIMRANGEPSNGAKAEAGVVSEANKEDKCRRP